jgi:hypothetical protein
MYQLPAPIVIVQNIAALILLPLYYLKYANAVKDSKQPARKDCAVFIAGGVSVQTMPDCLSTEFIEIVPCELSGEIHLGEHEKKSSVALLKRYWHSPFFVFKCMLKIGEYGAKIVKFNPRAIISCSEYSYTSSVLTEYCRLRRVEHINILHGEKMYNIHDAFVQYDRFYVWDEHYSNLLTDLRADKDQFRIAIPQSVKLNSKSKDEPIYDYTYYLSGDKDEKSISIKDALLRTGAPISRICIRYHPVYSDAKQVKRIYAGFQIENPMEVPLNISLSKTKYAVSLYSTVLYQAYTSGKEIIIDDVTDVAKYEKLKVLQYIMLKKPHWKLSAHLCDR